jgi:hypothetical protein
MDLGGEKQATPSGVVERVNIRFNGTSGSSTWFERNCNKKSGFNHQTRCWLFGIVLTRELHPTLSI